MKFDHTQLWRVENSPEKENIQRLTREKILVAADIVKLNHICGIEPLSDEDWKAFLAWLQELRDMKDWAFDESYMPASVIHHLPKKEKKENEIT